MDEGDADCCIASLSLGLEHRSRNGGKLRTHIKLYNKWVVLFLDFEQRLVEAAHEKSFLGIRALK